MSSTNNSASWRFNHKAPHATQSLPQPFLLSAYPKKAHIENTVPLNFEILPFGLDSKLVGYYYENPTMSCRISVAREKRGWRWVKWYHNLKALVPANDFINLSIAIQWEKYLAQGTMLYYNAQIENNQ